MPISTLTIDINARMASIEKDMGRVAHLAEKQAARMEAAFAKVGTTVAGVFAGLSLGAAVSSFRELVDQLDALNDSADATGASIENISGLEDVAKRTGASLEDVTSILVKFNGALKEADGKNGVSQALKAIGLDANELRRMDPAEALQKTAQALAGFADDGNKARLVQELFGKSVKEAAPFLKDLAEQGKLSVKVTSDQAAAAERFNKQMFEMQANVNTLARDITSKLLPVISDLIADLNDGAKAYGSFAQATFDIGWNVDPLKSINENMTNTVVRIREVKEKLAELTSRSNQSFIGEAFSAREIAGLKSELDLLEKREKYLLGRQTLAGGGRGGNGTQEPEKPKVPGLAGGAKDKPESKVSEIDREIEALQKKLQTAKDLTEVERVLGDVERGKLKGAGVPKLGQALDIAAQIDQAKELDEAWKQVFQTLDDQQKAATANAAEAARYFEASMTPAEKLEQTLARINELYNEGAFGAVGSADAIEKQARAIKAAKNETDQLNESAKELADIFTRAAERGDDLGKALETIIKKKLLFDPMAKSLEMGFQSLFSFAGSFFGGSTGSSNPGQYSLTSGSGAEMGLKLPGHKDGLAYVPRDDYVARLHKGERVLTAQENAAYSSGGGITVIQNNTIGSSVSRAEVAAAMEQARQATLATIAESQRNRGAFA